MSELVVALEQLARLLEAPRSRSLNRKLYVVATSAFTKAGKPTKPVDILVGDELYLQRPADPGAGWLSKASTGQPFGRALSSLVAGKAGQIRVAMYEKLWVTDGEPCEICDENAIAGWIPMDEEFPSGHDEPDAHPNCKCVLETRASSDSE